MRGRGSLLLDRSVTITKAMPQIQRNLPTTKTVLVVKDLFLSSRTIPPGSESEGDAPRWSMIESNDWKEWDLVLNCLLYGSLHRFRDHCTLARGITDWFWPHVQCSLLMAGSCPALVDCIFYENNNNYDKTISWFTDFDNCSVEVPPFFLRMHS